MDSALLSSLLGLRTGRSVETADQVLERVSSTLAAVGEQWEPHSGRASVESFATLMAENKFWPSGRILNGAGSLSGNLSSCYVLDIPDTLDGALDAVRVAALCQKAGGGTGFDLTSVRAEGAPIQSSQARGASGPVSWLPVMDSTTRMVMAGGKMRGANMATLDIRHPDVLAFVRAKDGRLASLATFSLSVCIDDGAMTQIEDGSSPQLNEVWSAIVDMIWQHGDPGILFTDAINRSNPLLAAVGPIRTTNPCGEQPMYPNESTPLGSLNLAAFVTDGEFDMVAFEEAVKVAVVMLDNAIEVSNYPTEAIARTSRNYRRLGLGVMGFADALISLGLPYDSPAGLRFIDRVGGRLEQVAHQASAELACVRGRYPHASLAVGEASRWRHCAVTAIAPTGTISMIAQCSPGIEPRYAAAWRKDVVQPGGILYVDSAEGDTDPATSAIRYAHDISPVWHVQVAARWQNYIDNGVSKTVNVSENATRESIEEALLSAWHQGAKGITVYRDGSREKELLSAVDVTHDDSQSRRYLSQGLPV